MQMIVNISLYMMASIEQVNIVDGNQRDSDNEDTDDYFTPSSPFSHLTLCPHLSEQCNNEGAVLNGTETGGKDKKWKISLMMMMIDDDDDEDDDDDDDR